MIMYETYKMTGSAHKRREQIVNMLPATAREIEAKLGYSHGGSFTQINNLLRSARIFRVGKTYHKQVYMVCPQCNGTGVI